MIKFRDIPFQTKLIFIQVSIVFVIIFLSTSFFVYNGISLIRSYKTTNLISITKVMGMNSASAILFGDKQSAESTLSYFSVQNDILNASIIDSRGKEFASYTRNGESKYIFQDIDKNETKSQGNDLFTYSQIKSDNKVIGTICVRAELSQLNEIIQQIIFVAIVVLIIGVILAFFLSSFMQKGISGPVLQLYNIMKRIIETGDYSLRVPKKLEGKDEIGTLATTSNNLLEQIQQALNNADKELSERKKIEEQINHQNWILNGASELNDVMRGEKSALKLAQDIISKISSILKVQIAALYFEKENSQLKFMAGYAIDPKIHNTNKLINFGEGLVGQAALGKKSILIKDIPKNYLKIESSLAKIVPQEIIISPFLLDNKVKGVIELGSAWGLSEDQKEFLDFVSENISIAVHSVQEREQMKELLDKTKSQSEDLKTNQEELKNSNEELTEQRNMSQVSEEELRVKHEELEEKNSELEEKTRQLEKQNKEIKTKNTDLENLREALTIKAEELTITGKYKSEFLANMSHELRTPLNSVMILAQLFLGNKEGNLTTKQVESAKIILKSGNDLLNLINDILDLTKIESGKMTFESVNIPLNEIKSDISYTFQALAREKKIDFDIKIDPQTPSFINTDKIRLMQILRNLLSNSFKFTPNDGKIEVSIYLVSKDITFKSDTLKNEKDIIAFAIKDTGIGIPVNKQKMIFEAFQQADASTSRKYGGTGLGLTISKEMIDAQGGEIHLESAPGKGSTFTIFLPQKISEFKINNKSAVELDLTKVSDDREFIKPQDKVILIVENDMKLAQTIRHFANDRNFKTIIATKGDEGLALAIKHKPHAVILDSELSKVDTTDIFGKLKENVELNNIPVHIVDKTVGKNIERENTRDDALTTLISKKDLDSTFEQIEEYIKKNIKTILIIEDNLIQNNSIKEMMIESGIKSISAFNGKEALEILNTKSIDCIILDLRLPDILGFELLEIIKKNPNTKDIPIIINTIADLTNEEEIKLKKFAGAIIVKTPKSKKRLMDEVSLFLHKIDKSVFEGTEKIYRTDEFLKGKTVLLVDDDIRNIYATMNVFDEDGLITITAHDGKEALKKLEEHPEINIILMDMMMPNMDGYEAMRRIRKNNKYADLPVIALTAKAMMGDREKCIEAGASDYISKPLDLNRLLSLMRVWLYK